MGSPVNFAELFNFTEYEEGIRRLAAANQGFYTALTALMEAVRKSSDGAVDDLSALREILQKVNVGADNFGKVFSYANDQIDNTAVKVATLNKVNTDLKGTIVDVGEVVSTLTKKMADVKAKIDTLDPSTADYDKQLASLTKEFIALNKQAGTLTKTLEGNTKEIKAAEGSYTFMSQKLTQLRKELKAIPGAFDEMTGAINEADPEVKKLATEIAKYDVALKKADATMGNFQRNVGNYTGANTTLKAQLKAMKEEMAQLAMEGKENSDRFRKLEAAAGELQDTLSDVSTAVKNVGSDTRTIEGIAGVFEGVAGAAALGEGAMTLFNIQNKEFEETLKRLSAIQAMVNGVQAIANMLQKESAAMLLISNARSKVAILQKNLEAASESKNVVVKWLSVAASKALNSTMAASPAGILLVVVAALAGALLYFTRNTKTATDAQLEANKAQKEYLDYIKQVYELREAGLSESISDAEKELALAKERGASERELLKLEEAVIAARLKKSEYGMKWLENEQKEIGKLNTLYEESIDQLTKIKTAQIKNMPVSFSDGQRVPTDKDIENATAYSDNLKTRIDLADKVWKEHYNNLTEAEKLALKKQKFERENSLKDEIAIIKDKLNAAKEGSKNELDEKRNLINKQLEIDLTNVNLTENEIKQLKSKAKKEIADLEKDYNFRIAQSELNAKVSSINAQIVYAEAGSKKEYDLKKQLVDRQAELDVLSANNSILNEEEKLAKIREINAKAIADKWALEKEKQLAEFQTNVESRKNARELEKLNAQLVLATPGSSRSAKAAARTSLSPQNDLSQLDLQKSEIDLQYQMGLLSFKDYEQAKTEIAKEQAQLRLDIEKEHEAQVAAIRQAGFDILIDGIAGVLEIQKENSQQNIDSLTTELQQKTSAIDAQKSIELKRAGDDKEKQIAIEEKFNEKKFQVEQRINRDINKEKRRQAQIDRDIALFNIAINTAQAVMKIWGQTGTAAILLQGLAIAAGAIQAGMILAKPLPKFKTGTMNAPEGPAILNDAPGSNFREIVISKKNGIYMPSQRNQVAYLNKGDIVLNADDSQRLLSHGEISANLKRGALHADLSRRLSEGKRMEVQHNLIAAMSATRINEKAIGEEVGKQLENIPQPVNNYDERGYLRSIRKKGSIINDLNSFHSL